MKKVIAIFLALIFAFALSGCSSVERTSEESKRVANPISYAISQSDTTAQEYYITLLFKNDENAEIVNMLTDSESVSENLKCLFLNNNLRIAYFDSAKIYVGDKVIAIINADFTITYNPENPS